MSTQEKDDHGKSQAVAQVETIAGLYEAHTLIGQSEDYEELDTPVYTDIVRDEDGDLRHIAFDGWEFTDRDDVQQAALEDAISAEVRSGWESNPSELSAAEFRICLCTGGPEVVIMGSVSEHGEPSDPLVYYRDWGTTYTECVEVRKFVDALDWFCGQFYFGE